MSHHPHSPRVPRDEPILPATAQDAQSFRDSDDGEQVELIVSGVPKPNPDPREDIWREGGNQLGTAQVA